MILAKAKSTIQSALQSRGFEVRRGGNGKRIVVRALGESGAEGDVDRLVYAKFFRDEKPGVMIEVGAARPDYLSVSALFRERDWRVLSIEPNPRFVEMHREKGHEIYQYACADADADDVEFCIVHSRDSGEISSESFSSLSIKPEYAALDDNLDIEKIRVAARRLESILAHHAPEIACVDCLVIDVEGWELEVLCGFDLERFAPRAVIIENLFDNQAYRDFMAARGYRLWKTLHPNEVYVRDSDESPKAAHRLARYYKRARLKSCR
jgi:FkbM family methyltransferase